MHGYLILFLAFFASSTNAANFNTDIIERIAQANDKEFDELVAEITLYGDTLSIRATIKNLHLFLKSCPRFDNVLSFNEIYYTGERALTLRASILYCMLHDMQTSYHFTVEEEEQYKKSIALLKETSEPCEEAIPQVEFMISGLAGLATIYFTQGLCENLLLQTLVSCVGCAATTASCCRYHYSRIDDNFETAKKNKYNISATRVKNNYRKLAKEKID